VRATTEVGENASTLVGAEIHENLLLVRGSGMLRNDTEELLGRGIRLNVGGPSEELAPCGDELASLVITPHGRPAALSGLHEDRLITLEAWDHEGIQNLIDRNLIVGSHDTDGATNLEVENLLRRVVGNVEIKVEGSLLGARLGELAGVVDPRRIDIVGRMRLNKARGLN
jgi:hypothetical protein